MARAKTAAAATPPLDWNDVRVFLAVARERTLARAAAQLGVDQTTVGRRIASLEQKLRARVLVRSATGLELTAAGRRVQAAAERMDEAAHEVVAGAAGDDAAAEHTLRIATTESLAEVFVVPAVRALTARYPRVHVIVSTAWARVDLRKGEADLAVRLVRPTDPRLACRKLAEFALRLYASRAYVAAHGTPAALAGHPLIAYEDAVRTGARHPFANLSMDGGNLVLMSNSHHVLLAGGVGGLGIVQLPSYVGDATPELARVFPDVEDRYAVWLVMPQANRRIGVVRAASEAIALRFREVTRRGATLAESPTPAPAPADRSPRTARRRP